MNFDQAIIIILQHEGGYNHVAGDPGGETNYGISKRAYPNLDIRNLTKQQAIAIYKRDYWNKNKVDLFPAPIRLTMFDMMVNMGAIGAGKVLQKALGHLGYQFQGTGKIGPATMEAVGKVHLFPLLHWVSIERLAYYNGLVVKDPVKLKFLKGWTKRTLDILGKS